eukprot:GDKI01008377.1.p1 GENE.GDKI01008377.1~~GDKI01008377.1.p1  ORF type:complete len:336 (+),score=73.63 GDKI01008377.1:63-1070(+)
MSSLPEQFLQKKVVDLADLGDLPADIAKDLSALVVDRQGAPGAFMTTKKLMGHVVPNKSYGISLDGFEYSEVNGKKPVLKGPPKPVDPGSYVPPQVVVKAKWVHDTQHFGEDDGCNILGKNEALFLDTTGIVVPEAPATKEALGYYGACLLQVGRGGDRIEFECDARASLPVFMMDVGENYLEGYLLDRQKGGGVYIEYHDRPHFHMPTSPASRGHLLLGKKIDEETYAFSAIPVPYGHAVYMPPWVLHDDGFLIGEYLVVYSVAPIFSTAIIRQQSSPIGLPVHVSISRSNSEPGNRAVDSLSEVSSLRRECSATSSVPAYPYTHTHHIRIHTH